MGTKKENQTNGSQKSESREDFTNLCFEELQSETSKPFFFFQMVRYDLISEPNQLIPMRGSIQVLRYTRAGDLSQNLRHRANSRGNLVKIILIPRYLREFGQPVCHTFYPFVSLRFIDPLTQRCGVERADGLGNLKVIIDYTPLYFKLILD